MKQGNVMKNYISIITFFFTLIVIIYTENSFAKSSVWKVTKDDDFVYIGGTIHILPPSEFPLPSEFNQAYNHTDSLVLETKLPDESDVQLQMQMMQAMMYSNGKSLKTVLSKRTYKKLQDHIADLGVDIAMFESFKPGALMSMLAMLEAQKAQLSGEGVDVYFTQKAKADSRKVAYLESAEFQINMLANLGKGHEDQFIKANLKQLHDFKPMFLKMIKAWRAGNTDKLIKLAIKPMQEDPKSFKVMLTDRNRNWVPHIEAMFHDADKEFVLVGVAHLVGTDNVLSLLKRKGYQVSKL
jgi:uncharacterized protein YbaP (TraB family)